MLRLAVLLLATCVCWPTAHLNARAASPRDTMFISVPELAQRIDSRDPTLVILQVGPQLTFNAGHIPGAQIATMVGFAPSSSDSGRTLSTELPTDDVLRAILGNFGITDESHVVIAWSDSYHVQAARIYLTLVHAGLGARTTMLDGGLPAWTSAGKATTTEPTAVAKSTMPPLKTVAVTVNAAYVQTHATTQGTVILDARSLPQWEGVMPATPPWATPAQFGHIPGSHNLPLDKLWDNPRGVLRSPAELEAAFAEAGVKPGDTVVTYCAVGQIASASAVAAQALGHPAFLYDGSMEEWLALKLPLEMPAKRGGGQ